MNRVSLAGAWDAYAKMALPPHCSPVQLNETRKAFYAGAITVLETCKTIGEPEVSEELGVQILDRMYHEGQRFVADVAGPRKES